MWKNLQNRMKFYYTIWNCKKRSNLKIYEKLVSKIKNFTDQFNRNVAELNQELKSYKIRQYDVSKPRQTTGKGTHKRKKKKEEEQRSRIDVIEVLER